MRRNREETEKRIKEAVGRIVLRDGFAGLGINAVAKEAGCDKVLIYRYFGSLEGLTESYVKEKDYFSNIAPVFPGTGEKLTREETAWVAKRIFIGQLKYTASDAEFRELLLWELSNRNQITERLAKSREEKGMQVLNKAGISGEFEGKDLAAIAAIIQGGITYLLLRSKTSDVFNGIDLNSDEGLLRIQNAVGDLTETILS